MRDARNEGTPWEISLANASRLAWSGSGPRRPIATPLKLGCCDARQIPRALIWPHSTDTANAEALSLTAGLDHNP